jgi:hypothetical protein
MREEEEVYSVVDLWVSGGLVKGRDRNHGEEGEEKKKKHEQRWLQPSLTLQGISLFEGVTTGSAKTCT